MYHGKTENRNGETECSLQYSKDRKVFQLKIRKGHRSTNSSIASCICLIRLEFLNELLLYYSHYVPMDSVVEFPMNLPSEDSEMSPKCFFIDSPTLNFGSSMFASSVLVAS